MVSTAQDLVTSGHYSTSSITQRKTELEEAWEALKEKTQERSVMLSDSVEVHQVGRLWAGQVVGREGCGWGRLWAGKAVAGRMWVRQCGRWGSGVLLQ